MAIKERQITDLHLVSELEYLSDWRQGYTEITRSGGKVTVITEWQSATKAKKFQEFTINRTNNQITSIDVVVYEEDDGVTELGSFTYTVTRSSGVVASLTRGTLTGFTDA
jgi:flagellar basal body rod protein FlgG